MTCCEVCHGPVPEVGGIFVGVVEDDAQEVALCPECAALVFPGMREAMSAHCPICEAQARLN